MVASPYSPAQRNVWMKIMVYVTVKSMFVDDCGLWTVGTSVLFKPCRTTHLCQHEKKKKKFSGGTNTHASCYQWWWQHLLLFLCTCDPFADRSNHLYIFGIMMAMEMQCLFHPVTRKWNLFCGQVQVGTVSKSSIHILGIAKSYSDIWWQGRSALANCMHSGHS